MVSIARHKTAITRQGLSAPVQALIRHGVLTSDLSFFDYGCGQGDDVLALSGSGISAAGWDPYFSPKAAKTDADVVNLGFVLNVIESQDERIETAQRAFALARRCLSVAVMIRGKGQVSGLKPHRDGYVTRRGTFQKYFQQAEIKRLIEQALAQEAIAVAPGVFFVFRDKLAEQEYLANRHRRFWDPSSFTNALAIRPLGEDRKNALLLEAHADLIDEFWRAMLGLGRMPDASEVGSELAVAVKEKIGSFQNAGRLCLIKFDGAVFDSAREARIDDLRVYFALNLFSRRKPYKHLPAGLQRDIKTFFGSQRSVQDAGKELLFSVGDSGAIAQGCKEAAKKGLGHLDGEHSLLFDSALLSRLPAVLRVYVGCGELLYGDVSNANVIKIHIGSGKITLMRYQDYDQSPLPVLAERVKIRLRDQDIDFFEYADGQSVSRLYFKSRVMAADQHGYKRQLTFDNQLALIPGLVFDRHGPSELELQIALAAAGRQIERYRLVRA